jgi:hypothetical protein
MRCSETEPQLGVMRSIYNQKPTQNPYRPARLIFLTRNPGQNRQPAGGRRNRQIQPHFSSDLGQGHLATFQANEQSVVRVVGPQGQARPRHRRGQLGPTKSSR